MQVFNNEGGAFDIDAPPHLKQLMGPESMAAINEPQHMKVMRQQNMLV
jgi:hypothetical protein